MAKSILEALRQPEYTGENRCEPCTVLNLAIGAVLSVLVARKSKIAGLFTAVVSIAAIYLRGYLVPGTPTLTKRYLPQTVLEWFGKGSEPVVSSGLDPATESPSDGDTTAITDIDADGSTTDIDADRGTTDTTNAGARDGEPTASKPTTEAIDLERFFLEHDVLEPCSESDDLCLPEAFEADWLEESKAIADSELSAAQIASAFGFEGNPETFELVVHGETHRLRSESAQVGRWASRPALVADIAANRLFRSRVSDWNTYDSREKGRLLNGLRMFLETCPTTGGSTEMSEEVFESCCRSQKVIAVTCEETGERLFEHRTDDFER
ncbi:hypothetical protein [Halostagnicola bangensis]